MTFNDGSEPEVVLLTGERVLMGVWLLVTDCLANGHRIEITDDGNVYVVPAIHEDARFVLHSCLRDTEACLQAAQGRGDGPLMLRCPYHHSSLARRARVVCLAPAWRPPPLRAGARATARGSGTADRAHRVRGIPGRWPITALTAF